jgi:hypothetical protein
VVASKNPWDDDPRKEPTFEWLLDVLDRAGLSAERALFERELDRDRREARRVSDRIRRLRRIRQQREARSP